MNSEDLRFENEKLAAWSQRLLRAAGLEPEAAEIVSESLVQANLRGVDSHGVLRLPVYIERIEAGLVDKKPRPRVANQFNSIALIDAANAPGQVAGVFAVDLSMQMASEYGIAGVAVRRSNHYGAAAFYAMRAANEGYISFTTTNVEPDVIPFGGTKPALGTNPIAFAAPADPGLFVLDMATSQVAMGKIFMAREKGEPIPENWAVDDEGRPTTSADNATALRPLGGPKGYGLALMVEILAGVLSGASVTHAVGRMYDDWEAPQDVGHFFMTLDPEKLGGAKQFVRRISRLWREFKEHPPAPGREEVLIPGEIEERTRKRRLSDGIPIPAGLFSDLRKISERLRVEPADPDM